VKRDLRAMIDGRARPGEVLQGLVESANDYGIKVLGELRKLSKLHPVDLPGGGDRGPQVWPLVRRRRSGT
jgi:hypothetical protein